MPNTNGGVKFDSINMNLQSAEANHKTIGEIVRKKQTTMSLTAYAIGKKTLWQESS